MYGIILAGGSGSRLWPLSRELYPKQLLNLNSDRSLLQLTYERLKGCASEIISITNTKHSSNIRMQLSEISNSPVVYQNLLPKTQLRNSFSCQIYYAKNRIPIL
ncbi:MAG: sugar phosphate nucleotidyltransferase [Candidatus Gastranaerophilaceae bacterium]